MNDAVDLETRIARTLKEEVAPVLQLDGNGIEVCGVDNGIVQVRLGNICAGCPSTIMAVVNGLEQELRQRIPEVEYLEVIP